MAVPTTAALKATPTSEGATTLTEAGKQGLFIWTVGDFSGRADDVNVVTSDTVPLTTGAWVRQSDMSLTSGAVAYGARGNGSTDDAARLQSAVDATGQTAFLTGGRLRLPRGAYRTTTAIGSSQFWNLTGDGQLASFSSMVGPQVPMFSRMPASGT